MAHKATCLKCGFEIDETEDYYIDSIEKVFCSIECANEQQIIDNQFCNLELIKGEG